MYIYMRHFKLFPPRSKAAGWQTEAELAVGVGPERKELRPAPETPRDCEAVVEPAYHLLADRDSFQCNNNQSNGIPFRRSLRGTTSSCTRTTTLQKCAKAKDFVLLPKLRAIAKQWSNPHITCPPIGTALNLRTTN